MDPADFTDQYNTALSPADEQKYQAWLSKLPKGQQNTYDYDMRGAYKAGAGRAGNGHFPDTFKKPNHPTFSSQSQYSGVDGYMGGTWSGDDARGYNYAPSQTNLKFHNRQALQQYFQQVEPGSSLLLPKVAR